MQLTTFSNGVAERWVGSCRREMLDHVIPLNEQHLRRLGRDYLTHYHEDRTHIGLEKETAAHRPIESHPTERREPRSLPRMGGLHIDIPGRQWPDRRRANASD